MDRRGFLAAAVPFAAVATAFSKASPQQAPAPVSPDPAARDWSRQEPIAYPDPDIVAIDSRFNRYIVRNTPIRRLHVGTLWAEGPAWNGVGHYLVWSDIPNDVSCAGSEETHLSTFRKPAGNSNGNTFDYEGRQLSCEHGDPRRPLRGQRPLTVLAETFQGKPLNAPNDLIVHPDGDIWFTDPSYGSPGTRRPQGKAELPVAVYRIDPDGRSTRSPTTSARRTGSAFRRTTRSCTSPTPADRGRFGSSTWTEQHCAMAGAS